MSGGKKWKLWTLKGKILFTKLNMPCASFYIVYKKEKLLTFGFAE